MERWLKAPMVMMDVGHRRLEIFWRQLRAGSSAVPFSRRALYTLDFLSIVNCGRPAGLKEWAIDGGVEKRPYVRSVVR